MISKWKMKAVVQKGISYLPLKERINYWFQKNVTEGVELTDWHFGCKMTHVKDHLAYFEKYHDEALSDSTVLELGTGWYPIVPIAFYLMDINEIYSLDLSNWISAENTIIASKKFVEWDHCGRLDSFLPNKNKEKWNYIREVANISGDIVSAEEICREFKLKRLIGDARKTNFKDASIDLICSNNTFEHIPSEILRDILIEFTRIIKPGGVMSHFIDMSDHFAHFDPSITIYNFLKYSDSVWALIDNSIQPQNRLRFKEYKSMYNQLGIPITDDQYRGGNIEALKQIAVDTKFRSYSHEELAISHGYLVSKMSE